MPAIRVVDRIQDQADFSGSLQDGHILKYNDSTKSFILTPSTYVHNQLQASSNWTVVHNMGKYPSVSVIDSAGTIVFGDVNYVDETTIQIQFASPFGGQAYLN